MRRAASPPRGEARPQKRICPPQTRSPHSDLSQPPLEVWCAERVHPHFSSVWQLGDAFVFPPLQSVLLPPAGHVLGDTVGSLLEHTDPVSATFQSSTSLSINPNKDAEGFPSWWRTSLLPGLLDTPTQVCLPLHDTLLPLSHFIQTARPTAVPSLDLSVVLEGLVMAPFEPLESAPERILTLKVTLLLVLTSLKRVGDLQALSVSEMCMDFAPGLVKVTLRPRPGYIPKVLSTSFRTQVVTLHSFHPPPFALSEDEKLHIVMPV